ncbi:MAG TPA: hypothetical protein VGI93_21760 [Steroidobacteraceae bacterium]|jgi:hypothetical protein
MNHMPLFSIAILASIMTTQCFADDAMSHATPNKHQQMKDCRYKHQMQDVNLSKSELDRVCKDELKAQKQSGATPPPPKDAPKEPAQ